MTDEQKQQIIALRRDGAGYGRIAARLQISINTVKYGEVVLPAAQPGGEVGSLSLRAVRQAD